jgi:hypothetical protein
MGRKKSRHVNGKERINNSPVTFDGLRPQIAVTITFSSLLESDWILGSGGDWVAMPCSSETVRRFGGIHGLNYSSRYHMSLMAVFKRRDPVELWGITTHKTNIITDALGNLIKIRN